MKRIRTDCAPTHSLLESRDALAISAASAIGFLSIAAAAAHSVYLGFNLEYFYPAALIGASAVFLAYSVGPLRSHFNKKWVPSTRGFLLLMGIGGFLRLVMLLNPNAPGDESYLVYLTAQNNPFNIVHFTENFNQIAGPFGGVTTPLIFILTKVGYSVLPTLQGARLVPFVLNVVLIPVTYHLAKEFASEKVAWTAALLYALSPGALYFLGAAETDIYLFFFGMTGLLFFLRGYRRWSAKELALSVVMFGAAYWSKATLADVWLAVAVVFGFLLLGKKDRAKKIVVVVLVVITSIALFLPWSVANPQSFNSEFVATPHEVIQELLSPGGFNLGGSGTVITAQSSATSTSTTPSASTTSTTSSSTTSSSTTPQLHHHV